MMYIQQLVHIQAAFANAQEAIKADTSAIEEEKAFYKLFPAVAKNLNYLEEQVLELCDVSREKNRIPLAKLCEEEFSVWLEGLNGIDNTVATVKLFNAKAKSHLQQAADHYYQHVSNSTSALGTEILREYLRLAFIVMLNHVVSRQEDKIEHILRNATTIIEKFAKQDPIKTERIILEICNEQEKPSIEQDLPYVELPQKHIAAIRDLTKGMIPESPFTTHNGTTLLFSIYSRYDMAPTGKYAVDQTGPRAGQPKLKYL